LKIALTGAAGFVRSHVLAGLLSHGHEVVALVRDDAEGAGVTAGGKARRWSTSGVATGASSNNPTKALSMADVE